MRNAKYLVVTVQHTHRNSQPSPWLCHYIYRIWRDDRGGWCYGGEMDPLYGGFTNKDLTPATADLADALEAFGKIKPVWEGPYDAYQEAKAMQNRLEAAE